MVVNAPVETYHSDSDVTMACDNGGHIKAFPR